MQNFNYSASLHVSHPDIDPDEITRALQLKPTRRQTRSGAPRTTPDGAPKEGHYEFSHWMHRFGDKNDQLLVPFLEGVAALLRPQRDFLMRIVNEDGEVQLFVGVFTETNCDLILPFELLGSLAELKIDLRLDLYGTNVRQRNHPAAEGDSNT